VQGRKWEVEVSAGGRLRTLSGTGAIRCTLGWCDDSGT
jgi:hypothetical protein